MLAAARERPELVAQVVPSPMTLELDEAIARYVAHKLGRLLFVRAVSCADSFAATSGKVDGDGFGAAWRVKREFSGNNVLMLGIVYEAMMRWVGQAATVAALGAVVDESAGDLPNVLTIQGTLRKDNATLQMT